MGVCGEGVPLWKTTWWSSSSLQTPHCVLPTFVLLLAAASGNLQPLCKQLATSLRHKPCSAPSTLKSGSTIISLSFLAWSTYKHFLPHIKLQLVSPTEKYDISNQAVCPQLKFPSNFKGLMNTFSACFTEEPGDGHPLESFYKPIKKLCNNKSQARLHVHVFLPSACCHLKIQLLWYA